MTPDELERYKAANAHYADRIRRLDRAAWAARFWAGLFIIGTGLNLWSILGGW